MAAALTIPDALEELNKKWFTSLKPRWVDIVGSYAGKELFLVDGDALIQTVLDDPLLEVGRKDCTGFFTSFTLSMAFQSGLLMTSYFL